MEKNYKLENGNQFHFHENDDGYDYTLYTSIGKEIDGGVYEYDFVNEKELPEWEVLELLANFADIPELLETSKLIEIEEIVEQQAMIKVFELYHSMSNEIKVNLGGLYIVNEIEHRFINMPELNERFTQDDKETIFEKCHDAWIDAFYEIGSGTITNKVLDALIEDEITINELIELRDSEVLEIAEDLYIFENDEDLEM